MFGLLDRRTFLFPALISLAFALGLIRLFLLVSFYMVSVGVYGCLWVTAYLNVWLSRVFLDVFGGFGCLVVGVGDLVSI